MDTLTVPKKPELSPAQQRAHIYVRHVWGVLTDQIKGGKDTEYRVHVSKAKPQNGTNYTLFRMMKNETARPMDIVSALLSGKDNRPSISLSVTRAGMAVVMFNGDWSQIPGANGQGIAPPYRSYTLEPHDKETVTKLQHHLVNAAVALMKYDYHHGAENLFRTEGEALQARRVAQKEKAETERNRQTEERRELTEAQRRIKELEAQLSSSNAENQRLRHELEWMKPVVGKICGLMEAEVPADRLGPVWNSRAVNGLNDAMKEPQGWNGAYEVSGVTLKP